MEKLRNFLERFASAKVIIILFILMVVINGSMLLFTLPVIESGGIAAFDMHFFGYSYETAAAFLEALSPHSRAVYLYIQQPLDFLYPVVIFLFLAASIIFFRKKKDSLYLIALAPFLFDILENILVISMLIPQQTTPMLAAAASFATVAKYASVSIVGGIAVFLMIKYEIEKKREVD